MLTAEKHTEVKVPCFDEGPNKLRRIHELHVSNDVVKNNAEFLRFTTAQFFDLLFLVLFDSVQCFYRFVLLKMLDLDKKFERTMSVNTQFGLMFKAN